MNEMWDNVIFIASLLIAIFLFGYAGAGCIHPKDPGMTDQVWLIKAKCDRDNGRFVTGYNRHGEVNLYACVPDEVR